MSITIVTGPPGAGKTTVTARLARTRRLGVHLVGDQVFHWIASGYLPPWMPGSNRQNGTVTAAIAAAAAQFDDGGYDVFVDGIVGPWFLPHWLMAANVGGPPNYVILRPSREVALARAVARPNRDDLVDPTPVNRMFDAFEDLGSLETYVVESSTQDPPATVETIEIGLREGRYVLTADHDADVARLATKFGIEGPPP